MFISLLGAFGSGKLKLGGTAWLMLTGGKAGADIPGTLNVIGFFCMLFGLIEAFISIVTNGSWVFNVLANPYELFL